MDTKTIKYNNNSYSQTKDIQIEIPYLCPHCEVSNNPVNKHLFLYKYESSKFLIGFNHLCTGCQKHAFTLQMLEKKFCSILTYYPETNNRTFSELLSNMSPRFVELYNQSHTSEQLNHFDLAGMGYRASLEVLIKDYALEFDLDSKEDIAKLNLNNAIGTYFKSDESIIAADVVGNDYTHWAKNHDNLPLEVFKTYLEIFIKQIEVKLMLKNPSVPTRSPE